MGSPHAWKEEDGEMRRDRSNEMVSPLLLKQQGLFMLSALLSDSIDVNVSVYFVGGEEGGSGMLDVW